MAGKGRADGIAIDGQKLGEIIIEKYKTQRAFSRESGIPQTSINDYVNEKSKVTRINLKLMCMMLGCTEEDLQKKAEPKTVATATNILLGEETRQTYEELLKEVHAFRNEMATLSKFIVEITRRVNEIYGQEQLTAEEIRAVHSKMAEINGNFSKVYAKMNHKY